MIAVDRVDAIDRVGEVYPEARLKVVEARDIPSRATARASVPAADFYSADILLHIYFTLDNISCNSEFAVL